MSITNKLRGGNMAGVLSIIGGFLLHLTLGRLLTSKGFKIKKVKYLLYFFYGKLKFVI